ncbi:MAG: hypothetical protein CBB87_08350 [Micavibrio sp. TMED27]|nr:quinolinate synthase [Micavibrio sp.]OUT90679.1 MAG: hypothetical protein CBB87_08350 [Micavibrio sp. TMED27]|tara:strand:+ start:7851 stop:8978 length:1128 start_codon:yes stop_codon:yes gene_type:complete
MSKAVSIEKNNINELPDPNDPAVIEATEHYFGDIHRANPNITREQWRNYYAPYIYAIQQLKKEKNAVILAHNYMIPPITMCVSDVTGDSLELGRATEREDVQKADIIVSATVRFMAQTTRTMARPEQKVLLPTTGGGCSLAESITPEDVLKIKAANPGLPVMAYANTYVDVRALVDALFTSSNAVDMAIQAAEDWNTDKVIMVPDKYLAENTQDRLNELYEAGKLKRKIEVLTHPGSCEVHERYSREDVQELRAMNPGIVILAHPECPREVLEESDFSGSTSAMIKYVEDQRPEKVALMTECSQGSNIAAANKDMTIVSSTCQMCPHMKEVTIEGIYDALVNERQEITIEGDELHKALTPLTAMQEMMAKRAAAS